MCHRHRGGVLFTWSCRGYRKSPKLLSVRSASNALLLTYVEAVEPMASAALIQASVASDDNPFRARDDKPSHGQ
jgi:hypothetical protein